MIEASRLFRLISRCTGESRKKYEDLGQVLKALPPVPKCTGGRAEGKENAGKRRKVVLLSAAAGLVLCILIAAGGEKEDYSYEAQENDEIATDETYIQEKKVESSTEEADVSAVQEVTEKMAAAGENLSESFERQRLLEETINAYGRLMEVEEDAERIRAAGLKKMELEMEKGNYVQALETAAKVTEKTGRSEEVTALAAKCEAAASGAEE